MSSFIHSSKMFNSVQNSIIELLNDNHYNLPYKFRTVYPALFSGDKKTAATQVKKIINTIREISVLCVCLQYKSHRSEPGALQKEIENNLTEVYQGREYMPLNKHGLVKSLGSIQYQIETEHLTELRPLTGEEAAALEFIDALKFSLSYHIVMNSKEADAAPWS